MSNDKALKEIKDIKQLFESFLGGRVTIFPDADAVEALGVAIEWGERIERTADDMK